MSGRTTPLRPASRNASRTSILEEPDLESVPMEIPKAKPLPPIAADGANTGRVSPTDSISSAGSAASHTRPRIIAFRREVSVDIEDDAASVSSEEDLPDGTDDPSSTRPLSGREVTTVRAYDGRQLTMVSISAQTEFSWTETFKQASMGGGLERVGSSRRGSLHGSRPGSQSEPRISLSRSSRTRSRQSIKADQSQEEVPETDTQEQVQEEDTGFVGPAATFPSRDDEYGIPMLDLSDSDTSDTETAPAEEAPAAPVTLPSIGPPEILKFKGETDEPSTKKTEQGHVIDPVQLAEEAQDRFGDEIDSSKPIGFFSGKCEFCEQTIKPFPTLEQQEKEPPHDLYCCDEYRQFVNFALFNPIEAEYKQRKATEKIDVGPHAPFGSKQARRAAKERAVQRMREREMQRAAAQAAQNTGGAGGGPANFYAYARQIKTVNYTLSSQRCLEEGWTIRPPSPLLELDKDPDVFHVDSVPFSQNAEGGIGKPQMYVERSKDLRSQGATLERYYDNGQLFLIIFPDGTGNVYYPTGNLAITITSVAKGQFTYIVREDIDQNAKILAVFEPDGHAGCNYKDGTLRIYLDQVGGIELDVTGAKKKSWTWKDQTTHVHAPPFQPICFAANKTISIRIIAQDNIGLLFNSNTRSVRFNVGARLTLLRPDLLPSREIDEGEVFLSETTAHVNKLLDRVVNLLKFPKSPKVDKMQPPLHVSSKLQKSDKLRKARLAQETAKEPKPPTVVVG